MNLSSRQSGQQLETARHRTTWIAHAAEAADFGRLTLPVLFIHAAWDTVCATARSRLAEPMRADCTDLSEVTIEAGHELMLERPAATVFGPIHTPPNPAEVVAMSIERTTFPRICGLETI